MIDVILLVSGSSKRMGKEKPLLSFSTDKSFICHLIDTYLRLPNLRVFVVVNQHNGNAIKMACTKYGHKIIFIENQNPEKGRLWSILTGLIHIKNVRGVFIQNIDNPFIDKELIHAMQENYNANSFLVPQFEGKNGHPLLLGADLVQELKEKADAITDLKSFLNTKEKNILITNKRGILANINSPEEYKRWFPDLKF